MNFAALWARNSGRATPSLRCTPNAPTKETRQETTYLQREAVQTTGASSNARKCLTASSSSPERVAEFLAGLSASVTSVPKVVELAVRFAPWSLGGVAKR